MSKASDDLPDPDSPVKTIMAFLGRSRETFFRLCSLAPRTIKRSALITCLLPASLEAPSLILLSRLADELQVQIAVQLQHFSSARLENL